MRQRGFTLIELSIVLVIVSMIAGAVAFNWRSGLQPALLHDSIRKIILADRQTRQFAASRNCECRLEFDSDSGRITSTRFANGRAESISYAIDRTIQISDVEAVDRGHVIQNVPEMYTIDYSAKGLSPTYRLRVQSNGESVWLLFAGGTGQPTQFQSKEQIDEVFDTLTN